MLNNETRELLVEAYKNYTAKELSEIFPPVRLDFSIIKEILGTQI